MNSFELDIFLREHTFFEKFNLAIKTHNDLPNITSFINDTPFDKNTILKFPLISENSYKNILVEFKDSLIQNKNFFEDKVMLHPREGIVFSCHPRFMASPEHHHDYIEMIYVYSGECHQVVNGNTISMKKGEICILDTNVVHSIGQTSENDIIINCLMSKKYLDDILINRLSGNNLLSNFFIHALYQSNNFNDYILFNSGSSEKLLRLMEYVLCEYFNESISSEELINSYMVIIFSELLNIFEKQTAFQNQYLLKNTNIRDVILYIQNNCKDSTLNSVSEHFHFHPSYLGSAIRKFTGHNFTFILQEAKLKKACFLLKNSDISVVEVANNVGYENTNFFYKIFKKYYGCNPTEYRKNLSSK